MGIWKNLLGQIIEGLLYIKLYLYTSPAFATWLINSLTLRHLAIMIIIECNRTPYVELTPNTKRPLHKLVNDIY